MLWLVLGLVSVLVLLLVLGRQLLLMMLGLRARGTRCSLPCRRAWRQRLIVLLLILMLMLMLGLGLGLGMGLGLGLGWDFSLCHVRIREIGSQCRRTDGQTDRQTVMERGRVRETCLCV